MSDLLDLIFQYLSTLGLAGLLAGVVIEAMGIPFPGGIMVILTGFMIIQGQMSFTSALLTLYLGYTAGALAAYFIGKKLGQPFFTQGSKYLHIAPEKFAQAQSWIERSAPAFIIFGRFLPGVSNLTPYLAGVSRIGLGRFLIYNSLFALGWGALYLMLGMFFGHNYQTITQYLNGRLAIAGLVILGLYLLYPYLKKLYRRVKV